MSERTVVIDEPVVLDEQVVALQEATERAERAEAELAKLKTKKAGAGAGESRVSDAEKGEGHAAAAPELAGIEALGQDSMMTHLLDSLEAGKDIGHYGRLVFAMVGRHFLTHEELIAELTKDRDFSEEQARVMVQQVEGRGYNPPKRDRILEWQRQQEFPILPVPDDPDCGNVYRNLKFPEGVYKHIGEYQAEKMEAETEQ